MEDRIEELSQRSIDADKKVAQLRFLFEVKQQEYKRCGHPVIAPP
jgi:DNA-binding PucR family transcriptional regulator